MKQKLAFCLMGPTAIGKTDLACELSEHLPLELISVDSSMVYQELNIGAAKPSAQILAKYPHHLVNCCNLSRIYSVADFYQAVFDLIPQIWARGHYPLLVGGTMMYFNALQQGLSALPAASPAVREQISAAAAEQGWPQLHAKLAHIDPSAAARIHPHDQQRIMRGLEIFYVSGRTWTMELEKKPKLAEVLWTNLAIIPAERQELHRRIALRLDEMQALGMLDEVKAILAKPYLLQDHPALKSVGYRQAIQAVLHQNQADNWLELALYATRQLAKRQITWLRGFEDKHVFEENNLDKMIALMKKLLDNN